MTGGQLTLFMQDADRTCRFAQALASRLAPGCVLLLDGPIGAGKTHFARCLIQATQDMPEDVPSPTYTLVQSYATRRGEVVHADLYRLGDTSELAELGLDEAFNTAICLVEWPDRLGDAAPEKALTLEFEIPSSGIGRNVTLSWTDPAWAERLAGVGHD
ncbi:tRNA (adenosine(37)-N6)-threonylcarbamoyltransferase complex ATPase subunit type 1 TsaE [Roseovarius salinarum]|uniref:tRNA (adenosine(37)-N6)-threonylcarbamoyltransferase complex ATPase subunit type 1 TsaE n=1 Tax=Roseovarius salinarum TaxID=1981892 RepID=UPI000C323FC2|nr:tRNA (adenosine(37)-N6)-threonylcarbamoyltransferase complex ATPase subunit type 1 TsaE [Roseovarius salinarum]